MSNPRVIIVPGTWGNTPDHDDWWKPGKPFWERLVELNYQPLSFAWSTELDGVLGDNTTWEKAGERLRKQILPKDTVIGHSHGGQVIAYACEGILVGKVITLATPVRDDVPYRNIQTASSQWTHVYGNYTDYWQLIGSVMDGGFHGWRRQMPLADSNIKVDCNHQQTHSMEIWDKYLLWRLL